LIAADTSSLIAFLSGGAGPDVDRIESELADDRLFMAPPVISELLSKPKAGAAYDLVGRLKLLEITEGHWQRAGVNRALLLTKGLKAKFADALIAQCCIDADVPLIARDGDYRHFARWCGLKLAL
jgi:predicted nucleic acid-binding protein